jgi:hypothetical protein
LQPWRLAGFRRQLQHQAPPADGPAGQGCCGIHARQQALELLGVGCRHEQVMKASCCFCRCCRLCITSCCGCLRLGLGRLLLLLLQEAEQLRGGCCQAGIRRCHCSSCSGRVQIGRLQRQEGTSGQPQQQCPPPLLVRQRALLLAHQKLFP